MQNLTIEFAALGDLKLAEKPTPRTIGPHGFHSIKVNFKVFKITTYLISVRFLLRKMELSLEIWFMIHPI